MPVIPSINLALFDIYSKFYTKEKTYNRLIQYSKFYTSQRSEDGTGHTAIKEMSYQIINTADGPPRISCRSETKEEPGNGGRGF